MSSRRRVAVVGAGYVGLVTGVGLAQLGHRVQLVESSVERLDALRKGRIPIHEEGLQETFDAMLAANRIEIRDSIAGEHDAILLCVGTPIDSGGQSDLGQFTSGLRDVIPWIASGASTLVIRSTLPPGITTSAVESSGIDTSRVVTNPEFLREGSALHDFLNPARIVIGTFKDIDPGVVELVLGLFDELPGERLIMSVAAAELVKNGSNALLALKLSFANELASLCEQYGADVDEVLAGVGADPRIGNQYMSPGLGFGGSCLPKELRVLEAAGMARGLEMHVTAAASQANAAAVSRFISRTEAALGGLAGRKVGLLGLAFKAGTDDVRDSPALAVATRLADAGAVVVAFDPFAAANAQRALPGLTVASSAAEAIDGADAVIIATEWPEFKDLPWGALKSTMRGDLLVDGRRLLNPIDVHLAGLRYLVVGGPAVADESTLVREEALHL